IAGVLPSSATPADSSRKRLSSELLSKLISTDLDDPDLRQQGASLLQDFASVFDVAVSVQALGTAVNVTHSIELLPDSQPLRQRSYRYSASERDVIREHVQTCLRKAPFNLQQVP